VSGLQNGPGEDEIAGPIQILLVEDCDADARALCRVFEKKSMTGSIERVVDGVAALEYLRDHARRTNSGSDAPIVLLVDINLPRLDGHGLVRVLREDEHLKDVTVFMLTASNDPHDIDEAHDNRVAGYVVKDVNFEMLGNLIQSLSRLAANRAPTDG
jgi:CheY-like chemotaxis protein